MMRQTLLRATCAAMAACLGVQVAGAEAPAEVLRFRDGAFSFEERAADLVSRLTLEEKARLLNAWNPRNAKGVERLGVDYWSWWGEANHGLLWAERPVTSFPVCNAMASTWNRGLLRRMGEAASDEARGMRRWVREQKKPSLAGRSSGSLSFWAPTINLGRDPRWGRADESYGEDPFLAAELAGNYVRGMMGEDATYRKTIPCLKHFAANNSEDNRFTGTSDMDERTLREYYTKPYERIVRATDVRQVMASYNRVNGVPSPANTYLQTELLRKTWGFGGVVVSDDYAIHYMIHGHHWIPPGATKPVDGPMATACGMKAGTDLNCGFTYSGNVRKAIEAGLMGEEVLDRALIRAFSERMRTGEFDDEHAVPYNKISPDVIGCAAHDALAEAIAREAPVLLKNAPAAGGAPLLPLEAGRLRKVVLLGEKRQVKEMSLGGYSMHKPSVVSTPEQGLREALRRLNPQVAFTCITPQADFSEEERAAIREADVAIAYVGTLNGVDCKENKDRKTIDLPRGQAQWIQKVAALNPRVVVWVQAVAQVNLEPFRENVPAIVWTGHNGQAQGRAFASLLLGEANPSGRLSCTWYQNEKELASITDYTLRAINGTKGRTYQYFTGAVAYPFGHGLSYTTFAYGDLALGADTVSPDGSVTATVKVTNTGSRPGQEVVQLYVASPDAKTRERPRERLFGFEKVSLRPGETKTVSMTFPAAELYYWDTAAKRRTYDLGTYEVRVGASSEDIRLRAPFTLAGSLTPRLSVVYADVDRQIFDLAKGKTQARITPSACRNDESFYDAKALSVTYASSCPAVIAVDASGMLTAKAPGVATITVTITADGCTKSTTFPIAVL